jgi:hypothetical protein
MFTDKTAVKMRMRRRDTRRRRSCPVSMTGKGTWGHARRRRSIVAAVAVAAALTAFAPQACAAHTAYVANFGSNNLSAYSIGADGNLRMQGSRR